MDTQQFEEQHHHLYWCVLLPRFVVVLGWNSVYTQEVQVLVPGRIYLQIYVLWDRWRILAPSSSMGQSLP